MDKISRVREYLADHFPNQPLSQRVYAVGSVVIDVTDKKGLPKELRLSEGFLNSAFSKEQIGEYFKNAHIAEQLESVPNSVSITAPV